MSSSSDISARPEIAPRTSSNISARPEVTPRTSNNRQYQQDEVRRGSKYDIYGTATKPFGASYRRSQGGGGEDETMGCSTSTRSGVAQHEGSVKGNFSEEGRAPRRVASPVASRDGQEITKNKLSDFEIIYGVEKKQDNNDNNPADVYSEIKKGDTKTAQDKKKCSLDPREKLMIQIRERKEETFEVERNSDSPDLKDEIPEENGAKVKDIVGKEDKDCEVKRKNSNSQVNAIANNDPVSFVEEEYLYEPGKQEPTSKLVVRSRSLAALEQTQAELNGQRRPNALKITTKPDGSIRYGLRHGVSESDLVDSDDSPTRENEIKNNYVSSIKNAFDAAIESQNRDKLGRAEAFDGLRQYFHENKHGLQELLINNNVVIIEPFRHEPMTDVTDKSESSPQRTCRITGATVKSPTSEQHKPIMNSNTLPRRNTKNQQNRQGFYHPIKVNKEIIDTELPDPEKVKSAREWFEKIFKSKSSSEVPSTKCSKSFFNTITSKMRITPEVKVVQTSSDKRRQGRSLMEQTMRKWNDSGSLSSGVGSDLSCDQDYHDSSSNPDILEEYSTEEDEGEYMYPYDDDERHPVSSEVLQKIRACGTTVTYYGGKVISRSHGQFRSPMTMSIMDEIRQSGGATENRRKFETDSGEEPYLGVKFRLVKSNSCGSRLEIAGTEDAVVSPRHESIAEEDERVVGSAGHEDDDRVGSAAGQEVDERLTSPRQDDEDTHTSLEEEEYKTEADRYAPKPSVMTWADLKLKEARKQWHCAPEAVRVPPQDMEFETFEVLDDSKPRKLDNNEPGRG